MADLRGRPCRRSSRCACASVPVAAAGAYAPGGAAAYPSTALMCCVPAKVAGVERVAVVSPPGPGGQVNAAVLAAAAIAGADEVYAIGRRPGDRRACARHRDGRAGGRDRRARQPLRAGGQAPALRAGRDRRHRRAQRADGDLRRDREPGLAGARPLRPGRARRRRAARGGCDRDETLDAIERAVGDAVAARPGGVRDAPFALVKAPSAEAALELSDALAPEHLELACRGAPRRSPAQASSAGCVFVGDLGATAFGDYAAGSNHVLPTGRRRALPGPLGPTRLQAPDRDRRRSRRRRPRRSRPRSLPWPAPRASRFTRSRSRPASTSRKGSER